MSSISRLPTRTTVALGGATALAAGELLAMGVSVRLAAAAVDGLVPGPAASVPLVTVTAAAVGLAAAVRRRAPDGAPFVVGGVALVVAAPVTAFGGGCGVAAAGPLFRSGVRVGIAAAGCVTYFNGALLVLGHLLLSVGLWLEAPRLPVPTPRRWRLPKRPD